MGERFGRQPDGGGRDHDGRTGKFSRDGEQALRQNYSGTNAQDALDRAENDGGHYGAFRTKSDEHGNHGRMHP